MSRYLVGRIMEADNLELLPSTGVRKLVGEGAMAVRVVHQPLAGAGVR